MPDADTLAQFHDDEEEFLDTIERKISEIKAKDSTRRTSAHNKDDMRSLYGRRRGGRSGEGPRSRNLNQNQGTSADAGSDHNKDSSDDGLDTSQENLSQSYWSDQEEENFTLRRRR